MPKPLNTASRIECINSDALTAPGGHYSHVCIAGGFVHISGLLPIDKTGQVLAAASFEAQVTQILNNLDACLASAGATRDSLVQVRIYVTHMDNWPTFNTIYAQWLGNHKPARAVAGVASLHFGVGVEVEAVALAPEKGD